MSAHWYPRQENRRTQPNKGGMMKWLFSPLVNLLLSVRNTVKMPLSGVLFSVPLLVALFTKPPHWLSVESIVIVVTFLIACYYQTALYLSANDAWIAVNRLAERLRQHDLRSHDTKSGNQTLNRYRSD